MNNPILYIMCGLAFSGKSTLARKIAEHTSSKIVAFDKLWLEKEKEGPISKDANGWRFIRKVGQDRVADLLGEGESVVYDDNNVRFEHREELREVARKYGAKEIVIYLNTPMQLIGERERINRTTGERHEVDPVNFQKVVEQLEPPTSNENFLEFTPDTNMVEFLNRLS